MRRLLTTVAAIALTATAAHGQGNSKGGDRGDGPGSPAAAQAGGKPDKGQRAGQGQDRGMQAAGAPGQRGDGAGARAERGNSGERPNTRAADGSRGMSASVRNSGDRGRGNDARPVVVDNRGAGRVREADVVRIASFGAIPVRGLITGCPPGLARKNPSCVPPGQARGAPRSFDRPDFWGLRLGDGRYWYDDGYLVRLGPDGRIGGYVPLLGGALAVGHGWPGYYEPVALPTYYESYYGLGPYDSYRYADNVIYGFDPETSAITSIVALLTGDDFAVGSPMPAGYDVYNVPYPYRDRYYDTPEARYRYSDGYIYQVDPETQLIAAAIELLAS